LPAAATALLSLVLVLASLLRLRRPPAVTATAARSIVDVIVVVDDVADVLNREEVVAVDDVCGVAGRR
jgi:putative cell wall-binding protein